MRLSPARARRGLIEFTTLFCTASALLAFAPSAEAIRSTHRGASSHSRDGVPQPLHLASRRELKAERSFVTSAKALHRCLESHPSSCGRSRSGLQRAGRHLEKAQHHLNHVALSRAGAARVASAARAPVLTASGQRLTWTSTARSGAYVGERTVAGQAPQAEVINGTSLTPPQVPGTTVSYRVRAAVSGAAWSNEVTISYPAATQATETVAQLAAPTLTVSGQKLDWTAVAGVSTYVLVTKAPGEADQYSVVGGTSITPPAVAGKTVHYSVRTAVEGSPWALEVAIAYPAAGGPSASEAASSPAEPAASPFIKGIDTNLGGWGPAATPEIAGEMNQLGVHWEREDLSWATVEPEPGVYHWSAFDETVAAAKANGITLLPIVGYAPSWTSPDNAAAYAEFVAAAVARYGPGTSANLPWWELWNEPYFAYAWSNKTPEPEAYARDALAAAQAAKAVAPSVKLLLAADYQNSPQAGGSTPWQTSWIDDMFAAAPTLGQWVDGISVHPYGDNPEVPLAQPGGWTDSAGDWAFQRIDTIREKFLAHGVNLPFWITEEGWSTWEVSEAEQASGYASLIKQVAARPWVRALFPYCLREFSPDPTNNQSGFGLLKFGTWQPKAAFYTLQEGLKTLS
jgi:hypothetical protein